MKSTQKKADELTGLATLYGIGGRERIDSLAQTGFDSSSPQDDALDTMLSPVCQATANPKPKKNLNPQEQDKLGECRFELHFDEFQIFTKRARRPLPRRPAQPISPSPTAQSPAPAPAPAHTQTRLGFRV